jgi:membrane dipeptidase
LGGKKRYTGYKAFQYLEPGFDYHEFQLVKEFNRLPEYLVQLSKTEEERYQTLLEKSLLVDVHEHTILWPEDMSKAIDYAHMGRGFTAYEALCKSHLDCVFDHLFDGLAFITSYNGWKWIDVIHDIGMRLSDLYHQDMIIPCLKVQDIFNAQKKDQIALVLCLESATPIENEIDRIDVLYGLGIRSLGICYSESNMLGGGMGESFKDYGLTDFGYDCVKRMNKLGMLIDVGHTNDRTAIETIESSDKPIYDSHSGPGSLAIGHIKGDEVLQTLSEKDGLLGVGGAGRGLRTEKHPIGSIESYMECLEYCIDLMGIDHVGCGPDTLYGHHQGLYKYWFSHRLGNYQRPGRHQHRTFSIPNVMTDPGYVKGLENPNEFINIARWMIKHGYSNTEIQKIIGLNVIELLKKIW